MKAYSMNDKESYEIINRLKGYKAHCNGKIHSIYVPVMGTWVKSEEIPCLCAKPDLFTEKGREG